MWLFNTKHQLTWLINKDLKRKRRKLDLILKIVHVTIVYSPQIARIRENAVCVQTFDKAVSYRTNACHRVSLAITCWTTFWNVPPTQSAVSGTPLVRLYNWIFANCMIARAHDKTVHVCMCSQRHFITDCIYLSEYVAERTRSTRGFV